ncbi:MAG: hypothetical protein HRO68_09580 [Nitrosopumilus sp.]|nr:hypothetical protein [Nitrosopumilus sp.]
MLIKLGIIAGIVILGGMIFSTEIDNIFPTTSATVFDSLMDDVTNFGSKASDSADQRIDESIDQIMDKTSNSITNGISNAGDKITNEISEVKESSQKTISEEISNFNPIEAITDIFTGGSSSSTTSSLIVYDTLSLSTTQQPDNNILLQYSDSSGKTQSVTVVIRTEQKEIFSGTFFTSMFETTVNDATGISYYVDMIVEHEDHGTITSSVFNPGDDSDTKINGIFSQS